MNKNSKYVCEKPFIYIETHIDGDITICCPAYVNNYAIGNFFEATTFEEIWNGEKAQEFRASVIDSSYKYCNMDLCTTRIENEKQKSEFSTIATNYPNIKFVIHSNGLFFDKKNCDELGITDKIVLAEISIHAATKKTYNKIVRDGNFDKVIKNIHWLSNLKQKNQIKEINLNFVITAINYKEMRSFQKLTNKLNCKAVFTTYRPWYSELATRYNEMAIFKPTHPDYNKFRKHLNSKLFFHKIANCKTLYTK